MGDVLLGDVAACWWRGAALETSSRQCIGRAGERLKVAMGKGCVGG